MSKVELTHEELQIIRACISVANHSIEEGKLSTTPREQELIENSDTTKICIKFLG